MTNDFIFTMNIKKRRGLSTVVTGAILLSAVAIMGTGLVSWSQSNLLEKQISLENTFATNINRLNENVVIENVWFGDGNPSNFINYTITNIGNIGLNVTEIEIRNSTSGASLVKYLITDGGIFPTESYSLNQTYPWITNTAYNIEVTTERESIVIEQVLAP